MSALSEIYRGINNCRFVPDAYYVPFEQWEAARKELALMRLTQRRGMLSADIEIANYLVAGVPVCVLEVLG